MVVSAVLLMSLPSRFVRYTRHATSRTALTVGTVLACLFSATGYAEPKVAKAVPVSERETTIQLQIFLDQQLFGPGKIDGRPGEFLTKALKRYQKSRKLPETGIVDENIPLDSVYPIYTEYTIQESDMKHVGDCPAKPQDQAKKKKMPYTGLLEFVSERYHCASDLLRKVNPRISMDALKPGVTIRVPNVEPFKIEEMPASGNLPDRPEFATREVYVYRNERIMEIYDGANLVASLPITPGGGKLATPAGKWRIVGIASMPTFRWDKSVLMTGKRSETFYLLPPGPNNPVGVAWIGLNKPGIGIHGTNQPDTIGRAASHGCMRLANWDAGRFAKQVTKGVKVNIY